MKVLQKTRDLSGLAVSVQSPSSGDSTSRPDDLRSQTQSTAHQHNTKHRSSSSTQNNYGTNVGWISLKQMDQNVLLRSKAIDIKQQIPLWCPLIWLNMSVLKSIIAHFKLYLKQIATAVNKIMKNCWQWLLSRLKRQDSDWRKLSAFGSPFRQWQRSWQRCNTFRSCVPCTSSNTDNTAHNTTHFN